jgi:hypothetical protein
VRNGRPNDGAIEPLVLTGHLSGRLNRSASTTQTAALSGERLKAPGCAGDIYRLISASVVSLPHLHPLKPQTVEGCRKMSIIVRVGTATIVLLFNVSEAMALDTSQCSGLAIPFVGACGSNPTHYHVCLGYDGRRGGSNFTLSARQSHALHAQKGSTFNWVCGGGTVSLQCPGENWVHVERCDP